MNSVEQTDRIDDRLARFLCGDATDDRGRVIREIVNWSDWKLESTHDYIQWVFPNATASRFNPQAPILRPETAEAIQQNDVAKENVRRVLLRLYQFYHFAVQEFSDGSYQLDLREPERRPWWITPGNHNFKRLSRILYALRDFGLDDDLVALQDILDVLSRRYRNDFGDSTVELWQQIAPKG